MGYYYYYYYVSAPMAVSLSYLCVVIYGALSLGSWRFCFATSVIQSCLSLAGYAGVGFHVRMIRRVDLLTYRWCLMLHDILSVSGGGFCCD